MTLASDRHETGGPNDLFRPEAVAEHANRLGDPIGNQGVAPWMLSLFFIVVFGVAAGFLCTAHYTRKENVFGQVTPVAGALRVTAARNGVVDKMLVKEGQHVVAGQELIGLSFAPKLESGGLLSSSLRANQHDQEAAQERQALAKSAEIKHQLEELLAHRQGVRADLVKLAEARTLQEERVRIQEQLATALRALGSQGMMPMVTVRAKDDDLIVARQNLAALEREHTQQTSMLAQLSAQAERLRAELQLVGFDAEAQREQMTEKRLNAEAAYADHLVAPVDGVVTALQVKAGAPVVANQTLAVVVPESGGAAGGALEVELWAPSKAIGFVQPGAPVRIMYDAFPYQTFGVGHGVATEVTRAPVLPADLPVPIETKEQLFRIRVALDRTELSAYGRSWPLSPGMRVSADLVLEERTLLSWLLDPLLAMRKRGG